MGINRKEAIDYLDDKEKITDSREKIKRVFSKEEEQKIREVQRKGKIYGDPIVELNSI